MYVRSCLVILEHEWTWHLDHIDDASATLMEPSHFCTQGGKDAASARYIYTRLAPMTRNLFHESDDALLDYLNEEGQSIEPTWWVGGCPHKPNQYLDCIDCLLAGCIYSSHVENVPLQSMNEMNLDCVWGNLWSWFDCVWVRGVGADPLPQDLLLSFNCQHQFAFCCIPSWKVCVKLNPRAWPPSCAKCTFMFLWHLHPAPPAVYILSN